jgi:peptidoglycan/LPS O-acetylase OafA/YrhL
VHDTTNNQQPTTNNQQPTTNNQHLQFETIDWLRFPLIICVVYIHSFGKPETVNMQAIVYSNLSGMDIYNILRVCGSHVITHICNMCFFMFSGFLFFYNITEWNGKIYIKKLKNRIKTLLIPYILWNVITVFVRFARIIGKRIIKGGRDWDPLSNFINEIMEKGTWNIFWHYNTWGDRTNVLGMATPSLGPYSIPMWFLQTLIILSIFTPVIYIICKKLKCYGIIALGVLYYTGIWFLLPGFGIGPLFFFGIGAYYSIHEKNMIIELRRYRALCYIITVISLALCVYYDGVKTQDYIYPIYILSGVICAVNIASYLVENKKIKKSDLLARVPFFVYAAHPVLILEFVGRIFDYTISSENVMGLIIRYFSVPLIAVMICVLIYCAMERLVPKTLKILSGNR